MDRGVFKAILLAVVLVGIVALAVAIFAPFLVALLWGAVLVTATYPIYDKLCARLGDRRTLGAALMTIAVLLVIVLPFVLLTPSFVSQAREFFAGDFQAVVNVVKEKANEEGTLIHRGWTALKEAYGQDLSLEKVAKPGWFALGLARDVARDVVGIVFGTLASLFFLVIALFYFFRDGRHAVQVLRELLPLKDDQCDLVIGDLRDAVNAAVRGGLLTALAQGVLGAVIVAILGIEGWVFWGAIIALAGLIPLVGTALVWLPMTGYLVWQGHPWKAVILAGYGAAIIGSADNLLRPIFVGQHMKAHPMLLFFGILGSIALFGFKGIVLGPVVVAALSATTTLFRREFAQASPAAG